MSVILYLSSTWGINVDLWNFDSPFYVPSFKSTFPSLSGMMALGLFIHNAVITIMKNNRHQENNVSRSINFIISFNIFYFIIIDYFFLSFQSRDLALGFTSVSGTYLSIGILFYVTFPMDKECIEDVSMHILQLLSISRSRRQFVLIY